MPAPMTATTSTMRQGSGSSSSHQAATNPTALPNVPGARGARPAPKPNATKWTGSRSVPTLVDRLEMTIAVHRRSERLAVTPADDGLPRDELTDAAQRRPRGLEHGLDLLGARRRRRETKLIVVAAAERVRERLLRRELRQELGRQRHALDVDRRAAAARLADVAEVGEQPVRDVDGRRRERPELEPCADARHRTVETFLQRSGRGALRRRAAFEDQHDAGRAVAERAGHVNVVADVAARARQQVPGLDGPHQLQRQRQRAAAQIAADELDAVAIRELVHTAAEAVEPQLLGGRQRQGERAPARPRAHGCEIAEIDGHQAVAEQMRRHAVREMHARDERVHRDGHVAVDREHGRIVADAEHDVGVAGRPREVARDDVELADHDSLPDLAPALRSSRELLSRTALTNLKLSAAP